MAKDNKNWEAIHKEWKESTIHLVACLKDAEYRLENALNSAKEYSGIAARLVSEGSNSPSELKNLLESEHNEGIAATIGLLYLQVLRYSNQIDYKLQQLSINFVISYYIINENIESENYEEKKKIVRKIYGILRPIYVPKSIIQPPRAIAHPETQRPCAIYAIASYDKQGRYTLEDRETKKRSGSYESIRELLPLSLTSDVPRKEGFIEARKKSAEEEAAEQPKKPRKKKPQ